VREFLERNHKDGMDREETIKLTVKSLLEVVQTGAKNIEIAVMAPGKPLEMLKVEDIEKYVESINSEKQDEANTRRGPRAGGQAGGAGAQGSTTGPAVGTEAVLASRPAGDGSGAPPE
jgi:20S proteasome subunit alpha 4